MADFTAAIDAVRNVCLGTAGSTRVVAPGALVEGAYEQEPDHEAKRALVTPTFEVEFEAAGEKNALSPSEHSNIVLSNYEVAIRTVLTSEHEFMEDERASVRASALGLLEDMRAALMRAGNLPSALGTDASFVSGCLHRLLGGHRLEKADWKGHRLIYRSRFATVIQFTQTPG